MQVQVSQPDLPKGQGHQERSKKPSSQEQALKVGTALASPPSLSTVLLCFSECGLDLTWNHLASF